MLPKLGKNNAFLECNPALLDKKKKYKTELNDKTSFPFENFLSAPAVISFTIEPFCSGTFRGCTKPPFAGKGWIVSGFRIKL
jgi:hypothetical protein